MITSITPLEKIHSSIVHKEFEDDVLVCNMRAPLPNWLPIDALKTATLEQADLDLLERFYKRPTNADAPAEDNAAQLFLRDVPAIIPTDDSKLTAAELMPLIEANYRRHKYYWVSASRWSDEHSQVALMNAFGSHQHHMSDFDRFRLSQTIDKLSIPQRPETCYFNMLIDTNNYFFYRKHHEHVPGIMILEVIRQAMYAQYYRYSQFNRAQISLTIENLNADFHAFINANYPVRIKVEDQRTEQQRSGADREERVATFYQLGKVVARATMRASVIKMNLFKRLRNVKPVSTSRFIPVKNIASQASFQISGGKRLEGRINNLSIGGINAGFAAKLADELNICPGTEMDCSIFVEGTGFIYLGLQVVWVRNADECCDVGYRIATISDASAARLREVIKNFTFVDTRREVL